MANNNQATNFGDLVKGYLQHSDEEHLRPLRRAVVAADSFDPDLNLRATVAPLLTQGDHAAVAAAIVDQMPGAALSPSAHRMLSFALQSLGETEQARREAVMSRLSVSSVLATGDGSQEQPWSVLRVADEYDILRAKGVRSASQSARWVEGRLIDRHETPDGDLFCFALDPAGAR